MRNLRSDIKSLRKEEERITALRPKLLTIKDEVLDREERNEIRWLLDCRIVEIKNTIKDKKHILQQTEEVKKLEVGQVYEHCEFADTIEIKNIYVEDDKIMVDTIYTLNLFGTSKLITKEYKELLARLQKEYVLVKGE